MTALTQITPSADIAEFRAAGTDLSERRRSGVSRGPLVDIVPTAETIGIAIGRDRGPPDRRLDDDRRDRGKRAHR